MWGYVAVPYKNFVEIKKKIVSTPLDSSGLTTPASTLCVHWLEAANSDTLRFCYSLSLYSKFKEKKNNSVNWSQSVYCNRMNNEEK